MKKPVNSKHLYELFLAGLLVGVIVFFAGYWMGHKQAPFKPAPIVKCFKGVQV